MTWPKFPRLRKEQNQWDNPEASTGIFIRFIGNNVCHEATGPAREIFDRHLGKEIKAILDGCGNPLQQTVIWSIYMIGQTKETTAPKVIFSCTDEAARKEVRKTIKDSGILRRYPGIGTGDSSLPPDFNTLIQELAIADIECATEFGSVAKNAVLCTSSDITFGRQIFIKGYNGDFQTLRRATAGGIVRFKDESYYLTVAHVFETRGNIPPTKMEDCPFEIDFDGQSDTDDNYDEDADVESTSRGSLTPEDARTESGFSSDDGSDVSTQVENTTLGHDPGICVPDLASANDRLISLTPRSTMTEQPPDPPTFLEVVGDLAFTSSDGPNSSLDVALIKLHDQNVYTVNEIPLGSEPSAPCLYSEKVAKIELEDVEIVTVTASRGLLRGRLSATPTYMRLPHSKSFQKVYTIRLDRSIVDGDCGSLVIHRVNGDLYGHIIAGSSGTGTAYIIPATQVFEDLEQRLGGAVSLPTRDSLPFLRQQDIPSSPIVAETIIPGPQDNFRPLSPICDNFERRSSRWSSQRVDDDFSRSFQRLDLGRRKYKTKNRRRSQLPVHLSHYTMFLASQPDWGQDYLRRRPDGLIQLPIQLSHNENFDGSHWSIRRNWRTHPSAGVRGNVSDQATGSFTDLASKREISIITPTTPTSSSDGNRFSFNNEAGLFELRGIESTNHAAEYHNVKTWTYGPNLQHNSQYDGFSDLQWMGLEPISASIPVATIPLQEPWSGVYRTCNGRNDSSDMAEEGYVFHQPLSYNFWNLPSMQYRYEELGQRGAFHIYGHEAYTNNQQHSQSPFTAPNNAYREGGRLNSSTPDSVTSASSGSPASSTTITPHIPGRRNRPLSLSGRLNVNKMRKEGSCFRCIVKREKYVTDTQSKHDGMCERCRDMLNDWRTWNLPYSQRKLQDRLEYMLPEALASHLRASQVREYIKSNTEGLVGSFFKLEIEMDFGTPLVLDVVQFVPRSQGNGPMLGFQLTHTGSSKRVMLESPPIIPVLLNRSAIWENINRWLDSISSGKHSTFPDQYFPEYHEQWQREILKYICTSSQAFLSKSETQEGRAFQTLRRALRLTVLNHIMCHPFTVPDDKVEALLGRLHNYQPIGSCERVCPRMVNRVVKSFCVSMLKKAKEQVLEHLHKILRSTTAKEALWDQAFSIVFLCLIAIGNNQLALLERAQICAARYDGSFSIENAMECIKEMEYELAAHLIGMFHQRFCTNKKGTENGKPFNPLAMKTEDRPRNTTKLMDSIRHATERVGWDYVSAAAELELLDLDKMKLRNVTRLLCTFMRPFAPEDAQA